MKRKLSHISLALVVALLLFGGATPAIGAVVLDAPPPPSTPADIPLQDITPTPEADPGAVTEAPRKGHIFYDYTRYPPRGANRIFFLVVEFFLLLLIWWHAPVLGRALAGLVGKIPRPSRGKPKTRRKDRIFG